MSSTNVGNNAIGSNGYTGIRFVRSTGLTTGSVSTSVVGSSNNINVNANGNGIDVNGKSFHS